jgi:D-alanyl-D-alanine carboxypeptidase/D-alanyl-D-alanine-endopeptidase (penicillin-binding protein 4)
LLLIGLSSYEQDITKRFQAAARQFESDSQMRHAIYSLYVIDAKTGKAVFDKNSQIGLAPASCQKLFTSGAAFELLGHDYRYKTRFEYVKYSPIKYSVDLLVTASGDPTFGTWRFKETQPDSILNRWTRMVKNAGIHDVNGIYFSEPYKWSEQTIPGGWIWEDIGNYYGAGASYMNWRENQYDLILKSGNNIGDSVMIVDKKHESLLLQFESKVRSAAIGSGDNAYIYFPLNSDDAVVVSGTIPVNEKNFVISGAIPSPRLEFAEEMKENLESQSVVVQNAFENFDYELNKNPKSERILIDELTSPPLDSINYWFLRRSINLYGEAFVKTIALEKKGFASTEDGVELVKDFWSQQGIDKAAINIIDGSGLSPQNRVSTNALVKVLQYAKTRPWYNSFYLSLPTYNSMKMKSGSIGGARSFAGYQTSKDGHEYIFAIIVNNYDGSSNEIVKKMYQVLDVLK